MISESTYVVDPSNLWDPEFETPKEYFKVILDELEKRFGDREVSLIDVGCASGAFLFHAFRKLNVRPGVGVDISEEHLALARQRLPNAAFSRATIQDRPHPSLERKFDVATCLGLLAVFEDVTVPFSNLLAYLKPGGLLVVYDLFNDDPVDVIVRHRLANEGAEAPWRSAFNVRSVETWKNLAKQITPSLRCEIIDFKMPFEIPKAEPLRAWTIRTDSNPYQLTVGTGQLLNFKFAFIRQDEAG